MKADIMKDTELSIIENEGARAFFTTRATRAFERREALSVQSGTFGGAVIWPHLVHGTDIAVIGREQLGKGTVIFEDHDGAVTDVPGIALTVTCGDCLPIYAWDPARRAAGLVHAGWRGTLAGIAAELVYTMQREYGSRPEDLQVRIGPGIDACCFEVKEDCYGQFLDKYPWAEGYMYARPDGSFTLDLKGINLEILSLCGVEDAQASPLCTCCEEELFYSWRGRKEKDRMLACIYIKGSPRGEGAGFKPALAVSACLAGEACRYDGKPKLFAGLAELSRRYHLVPVCPERLGGLPTPRNASEIRDGRVLMKAADTSLLAGMPEEDQRKAEEGSLIDVTKEYEEGASLALAKALAFGAVKALLKSRSPSCGAGSVYDGSFRGTLAAGDGVFASLLRKKGFTIFTEEDPVKDI